VKRGQGLSRSRDTCRKGTLIPVTSLRRLDAVGGKKRHPAGGRKINQSTISMTEIRFSSRYCRSIRPEIRQWKPAPPGSYYLTHAACRGMHPNPQENGTTSFNSKTRPTASQLKGYALAILCAVGALLITQSLRNPVFFPHTTLFSRQFRSAPGMEAAFPGVLAVAFRHPCASTITSFHRKAACR